MASGIPFFFCFRRGGKKMFKNTYTPIKRVGDEYNFMLLVARALADTKQIQNNSILSNHSQLLQAEKRSIHYIHQIQQEYIYLVLFFNVISNWRNGIWK